MFQNKHDPHLTYHHGEHTLRVVDIAAMIATHEKTGVESMRLIKTAALFHDTGFLISPKDHEQESIRIARQHLPALGYSQVEIDIIAGLILATEIPQQPKTHEEMIVADADLEYMGTDDFDIISDSLFRELTYFRPTLTEDEWNSIQISFLQKHHYHTEFCKKFRAPKKRENLQKLIEGSGRS